jgi:cyclophilin family peptidyl-prolyl cis-trans isomerase
MQKKMMIIGFGVIIVLCLAALFILKRENINKPVQTTDNNREVPPYIDTPPTLITPIVESTPSATVPVSTPTPTKGETMGAKQYSSPPALTISTAKKYTATVTTTKGTMTFSLFAKEVPVTVNNFVFLAKEGFYIKSPFHRIIKGFMIQGGDPTGTGRGGPGYQFADEKVTRQYTRGTIAMANAGPNTNGSQFFVMHADYALPPNYTIFGSIEKDDAESFKTLDSIANSPVTVGPSGEQSTPTELTTITKITIKEE